MIFLSYHLTTTMPPDIKNLLPDVTAEQQGKLELYAGELLKWNKTYNLVGRNTTATIEDIWQRHILDSAQLIKYIPLTDNTILTDFGSGAGLPGIILSILGVPETHLIESNRKKCSFLKEISHKIKTNIHIHNERIEKISPWKNNIITARALADLDHLLALVNHFLTKDSLCIFPKGSTLLPELEKAKQNWSFDYELKPSITGDGYIVVIRNCRDTKLQEVRR